MVLPVNKKLLKHIELKLKCTVHECNMLGHGEHNINYCLNTNKGKFVLRTYANSQFDNSRSEYAILKKLNGTLGPKVFYLDTSKKFIDKDYVIQEFIEGSKLKKFNKKNIIKIANLLKNIHKIKDSRKRREWKHTISPWTQNNILNNSKFLGEDFHKDMKLLYEKVLKILDSIRPLVVKYQRDTLIHEDPVISNFIEKKNGEIVLIDWELSLFDYFFLEFGCIIAENHLSKNLEKIFLETYGFGKTISERRIIHAAKINRILSWIGWFIERIAMSKNGKKSFEFHDNNKYETKLKREIQHINRLLKEKIN